MHCLAGKNLVTGVRIIVYYTIIKPERLNKTAQFSQIDVRLVEILIGSLLNSSPQYSLVCCAVSTACMKVYCHLQGRR